MKGDQHPRTVFEQMTSLEVEYGVVLKLEDKFQILIAPSPMMYHSNIVTEQRAKGTALTVVDDLEHPMTTLYRTLVGSKAQSNKKEMMMIMS